MESQDLHQIAELLQSQLEPIRSHLYRLEQRFDGLERRFDGLEKRFDGLEHKLNFHVAALHERIDETNANIGYYFEQCASKDDHHKLVQRMEKVEAVVMN